MANELAKYIGKGINEVDSVRSEQVKQDTLSNYFVLTDYRIGLKANLVQLEQRTLGDTFILDSALNGVLDTNKLDDNTAGSWADVVNVLPNVNLTKVATEGIAKWLNADSSTYPTYFGFGTGTTAYSTNDVALVSESGNRVDINTYTNSTSKVAQFQAVWVEASNRTVREIGLFDASALTSPVAHYKLNGDSSDEVSGNDGTDTSVTYPTGKIDQGAGFNGSGAKITVPAASQIENIFDGGGAISCWVKVNSDGQGNSGRICDKTNVWYFGVTGEAAGKVKVAFGHWFTGDNGYWVSTSTEITIGIWTHVVVIYDSDDTDNNPTVYVNGATVDMTEGDTPTSTRESDAGLDLFIGDNSGLTATFDGIIDDFRVYDFALTSAEIDDIYNSGNGIEWSYVGGDMTYRFVDTANRTLSTGYQFRLTVNYGLSNETTGTAVVTDEGLNEIRDFLTGNATTAPTHTEWNDATTTPLITHTSADWDTGSGNEQRNIFATTTRTKNVTQFETLLTTAQMNSTSIRKSGNFNAGVDGTLFGQTLYGAINKTALFQVYEIDRYTVT